MVITVGFDRDSSYKSDYCVRGQLVCVCAWCQALLDQLRENQATIANQDFAYA